MNLKLVYCRRWLDVITQRLTARETTNYHIDSKMPFTAGLRFWFHDQQSCQLRMLSSPTTIQTPEDSSLDWFVRCLILGLLLSLGANAASYFFRSENIVDLIGNNQQVSEAIGFPDVYWRDSENVKTLPTRKHEGLVNYPVLGWNLMYGLISGVVLGILAAVFRQRLNELTKKKIQLRSRQSGSFFQISMHGILLLTTVVSLTVAVFSQFNDIHRKPVVSSNLASMGYNPFIETLEVEFHSGSVYQYFRVPKEVYRELESADSLGSYLSRNIRNEYPYERSTGKETSVTLLAIFFLGPIYLFTLAALLHQASLKTRYTIASIIGAGLACLAMSSFIRLDMNPDRVLMGLFVCWMPQFAFFCAFSAIIFVAQAFFLSQLSSEESQSIQAD